MTKGAKDRKKKDPVAAESGKRLAACREDKGWTQQRLAAETGWSEDAPRKSGAFTPSGIGMYEQGARRIRAFEAQRFSEIFPEHHPAYFMGVISERESRILVAAAEAEVPRQSKKKRKVFARKNRRQPEGSELTNTGVLKLLERT